MRQAPPGPAHGAHRQHVAGQRESGASEGPGEHVVLDGDDQLGPVGHGQTVGGGRLIGSQNAVSAFQ